MRVNLVGSKEKRQLTYKQEKILGSIVFVYPEPEINIILTDCSGNYKSYTEPFTWESEWKDSISDNYFHWAF